MENGTLHRWRAEMRLDYPLLMRDGEDEPVAQPERIGPYRILERLGEGGFGEVYAAEQPEPARRVALKILKPGMDSKAVLARFEAERQALALMDHPNIATIFDAGATKQGRPYFVMELVHGIPITKHCDTHRADIRERLLLFAQVCDGIQHAHQKAIIHRDIKPSNILVAIQDGKRVPKIIDFGVAKAMAQPLTERTLITEMGQLIGTPAYMSPEQAEMTGQNIDTRTDVYSLGAVLYELLVGAPPFDPHDLIKAGFEGILRVLREEDPKTPSTRIGASKDDPTTTARNRRTEPARLTGQLRGDLDWITMKALEKDRTRRYGSPAELAADIERHLNHRPVLASPPSRRYRAGKFLRRHSVAVGSLAALFVLLSVFAVTMTIQSARVSRERDRANQERDRANREAEASTEVSEFLADLFEVSDPSESRGNSITARELLDKGAERIRGTLQNQPEVRARLMGTIGGVYRSLGLPEQGRPLLEEALESRRDLLGGDHLDVAESLNELAGLLHETGDYAEARSLHERALEIRESRLGPDHPDVAVSLNNLGHLLYQTGDYDGARPLYERALGIKKNALGPDNPGVAPVLNNLANLLRDIGDYDGARPLYERAIAIEEAAFGPDHPEIPKKLNNLAIVLRDTGDHAAARPLLERALAIWERTLGPDHPNVAGNLMNLAIVLSDQGDYVGARRLYERALSIDEKTFGPEHPNVGMTLINLANLLTDNSDPGGARPLYERALAIFEKALGPDHPYVGNGAHNLAKALAAMGDHAGARPLYQRAQTIFEQSLGADHPFVAENLDYFARTLRQTGEDTRAAEFEVRVQTMRAQPGSEVSSD